MIKINLIPKEELKRRKGKRAVGKKKMAIPTGMDVYGSIGFAVIIIIFVFIIHIKQNSHIKKMNKEITQLQSEYTRLKKEVDFVHTLERKKAELQKWVSVVQKLNANRSLRAHLVDEINRLIPNYLWLNSLKEDKKGKITIVGTTFSNLIVADFVNRLNTSPYLSDIVLVELKRATIEGHDVMDFTITATLSPPKNKEGKG